jgi:hypothetical protein
MKRIPNDLLIGGTITAVGVLMLLLNLGLFGDAEPLLWAVLFMAGGLGLLSIPVRDRAHWWALIPGGTLLGIGLLIALSLFAPAFAAAWGGTIVLGGIGAGFAAVYLLRPQHWWAIIPAGTLLTLAAIAGLSARLAGAASGALLFGSLALTFGLVAVAPPDAPRRWALFPAGGLLIMAAVVLVDMASLFTFLGPALLIAGGAALLMRGFRHRERRHYEDEVVSQPH